MKTIRLFLVLILVTAISGNLLAEIVTKNSEQQKTETFKVYGNCNMCKNRIEKAVKEEGATSASWDSKTKMLSVTFDPSKTSLDALSKKLALVGHDTEKYKATNETYSKLDACCHYERAK